MSATSNLANEQKDQAKSKADKIAVKLLHSLFAGDYIN